MEKMQYCYEPNFEGKVVVDNVWRGYENPFRNENVFGYLTQFDIVEKERMPKLLKHVQLPYIARDKSFPNRFYCNFEYSQIEGVEIIDERKAEMLFAEILDEKGE